MTRRVLAASIIVGLILSYPAVVSAKGRFEYYIFGVNIRTFENSNWLKVAAGAAASIVVHELGHAMYLELADKEWELRGSYSGLAIVTPDHLSADESRGFGMAGFALQSAVATMLTSFEKTRTSDFTKGWVGASTLQLFSYTSRPHVDGNDFQMIERAGGDAEQIHGIFTMISGYNFRRLQSEFPKNPLSVSSSTQNARFYNGYYLDTFDADPEARFHALEIGSFLDIDPKEDFMPQLHDTKVETISAPLPFLGNAANISERPSNDLDFSAVICKPFGAEAKKGKLCGSGFE
jgi:hypothetical protein